MAHATRTPRPTRTVNVIAVEFDDEGNSHFVYDGAGSPVIEELTFEVGRRAGLHTSKSAIRERQRRFNRADRHAVRAQLRRNPDDAELRQARGRALWSAS